MSRSPPSCRERMTISVRQGLMREAIVSRLTKTPKHA
ncbi:hypothetical protein E2C01_097751 [Portunus trituberculatus]|uniref:Uncharacterized protein n=1 Tax=Portunus trituberculatus TaxID=210409 RepID=A0A5B7K6H6_PORTR|nr:hypothetical protein [Portunus trituberculatus]